MFACDKPTPCHMMHQCSKHDDNAKLNPKPLGKCADLDTLRRRNFGHPLSIWSLWMPHDRQQWLRLNANAE